MQETNDSFSDRDDDEALWNRVRIGPVTLKQLLISGILAGLFVFGVGRCVKFSRDETGRAAGEIREHLAN